MVAAPRCRVARRRVFTAVLVIALASPAVAEDVVGVRAGPTLVLGAGDDPVVSVASELVALFGTGPFAAQFASGMLLPSGVTGDVWLSMYTQFGVGLRVDRRAGSAYALLGAQLRIAGTGSEHTVGPAPYAEVAFAFGRGSRGLVSVRAVFEVLGAERERFGSNTVHPVEVAALAGVAW